MSDAGSSQGHGGGGSHFVIAGPPAPHLDSVSPVLEISTQNPPLRGRQPDRSGFSDAMPPVFGGSAAESDHSCVSHLGTATHSAASERENSVIAMVDQRRAAVAASAAKGVKSPLCVDRAGRPVHDSMKLPGQRARGVRVRGVPSLIAKKDDCRWSRCRIKGRRESLLSHPPDHQWRWHPIRTVLARAVQIGGSTLKDFSNAQGESGYFQLEAAVYGREGLPCRACGGAIKAMRQGQRSTFFCAVCQKP